MTRNDLFMAALQVYCTRDTNRMGNPGVAKLLDEASVLPVEALADQPTAKAALDFFDWHALHAADSKRGKPKWLAEFERVANDRMVVRVNSHVAATTWWMHAERSVEDSRAGSGPLFPATCEALILGRDTVAAVTRQDAFLFRQWVESIAGCEEFPFLFEEVK